MKTHAPPILIWFCVTIGLLAWLAIVAPPHKTDLLIYKLTLLAISSFAGLIVDYVTFPGSRPKNLDGWLRALAEIRRAIIIMAAMICVGVGL